MGHQDYEGAGILNKRRKAWLSLKKGYLRGDLPAVFKYLIKVYREDGARLFLDTRKNKHKLEEGTFQLGIIKRISPMKSGQTLEQLAQNILGDIKNPAGHGPEKPDLTSKLALLSAGVWTRCSL